MTNQATSPLLEKYKEYLHHVNVSNVPKRISPFDIANELNMDLEGKLKFVNQADEKKEAFLLNQLNYQLQLLEKTEKSKHVFHLN
jgi:hypothetical protein